MKTVRRFYFMRLPKNKLELWARLSPTASLNPVFREFYSERDVVFESGLH